MTSSSTWAPHSRSSSLPVTLKSVSQIAGVSLATASKALSNKPRVSAKTRQKVVDAAHQIGYQTPKMKNRQRHVSLTIGLITSDLSGRFSTPILIGAEHELSARHASILLANAQGEPLLEQHDIRILLEDGVDGLIIVNPETDPRPPVDFKVPVPLCYAYAPSTNPHDCSVTVDNVGAGRIAANHILRCGKKRIALITGPKSFAATRDRIQGVEQVLAKKGLKLVVPPYFGQWDEGAGRGMTRLLLEKNIKFDAVICGNDQIARGCIDVLKQKNISIPENVAVIGHDNWHVLVDSSRPTLTTIDNNLEDLGSKAALLIVDAINGHPHEGTTLLPCKLIQRESTLPSF